jgi:hypothetical protein
MPSPAVGPPGLFHASEMLASLRDDMFGRYALCWTKAMNFCQAVDGYQVNFRVPSDAPRGTDTIQVGAAWIESSQMTLFNEQDTGGGLLAHRDRPREIDRRSSG